MCFQNETTCSQLFVDSYGFPRQAPPFFSPAEECQVIVDAKAVIDVLKRDKHTWKISHVNLWSVESLCEWLEHNSMKECRDRSISLDPRLSVCEYEDMDQERLRTVRLIMQQRFVEWETCFSQQEKKKHNAHMDAYRNSRTRSARLQASIRFPHISQNTPQDAVRWTLAYMHKCFLHTDKMMEDYRRGGWSCAPPLPP
jgi:hypothetical protein